MLSARPKRYPGTARGIVRCAYVKRSIGFALLRSLQTGSARLRADSNSILLHVMPGGDAVR